MGSLHQDECLLSLRPRPLFSLRPRPFFSLPSGVHRTVSTSSDFSGTKKKKKIEKATATKYDRTGFNPHSSFLLQPSASQPSLPNHSLLASLLSSFRLSFLAPLLPSPILTSLHIPFRDCRLSHYTLSFYVIPLQPPSQPADKVAQWHPRRGFTRSST